MTTNNIKRLSRGKDRMRRDRYRFQRGWIGKTFLAVCAIAMTGLCAQSAGAAVASNQPEDRVTRELFDSGVPRDESALVANYFSEASARMKRMVLHPVGMKQSSREFRQARAAALVEQVNRISDRLKLGVSTWTTKSVPTAYRDGKARADQQAIEAGVRPRDSMLKGSFNLIDERAVVTFARNTIADFAKAADSMADRAASILRQTAQIGVSEADIDRVLAGGVIEGTPRQTIRALRDELRRVHGDEVEVVGRSGEPMNFKVDYYAELVARTKTREAVEVARHERLQEHGLDLVSIVGRVSKSFCTAFLGQVFSLSGTSSKYPALASLPGGGPPFHPQCSKSTRPFIEHLASGRQLDLAGGLGDARKLIGKDVATAQRAFKDLQIYQQQKDRYATTAKALFG
jgi:hypothetical protein